VAVDTAAPASPVAPATPDTALEAIEAAIRTFLAAYRPEGPEGRGGDRKLAASGNLWREVSSLTMLQLVAFVENKFAITVRPIDFAPQNFSSISAIARLVAARRQQAGAP